MNPVASPPAVLLHVTSTDGHRGSYLSLLGGLLNGVRASGPWQMLRAPTPVFFLTLEGAFGLYCFIASLRVLSGRQTLGLLLRPGPALTGQSLRLRIKRRILKWLRCMPKVQTFTILPFSVEPGLAEIADGWIHDPQLWDLTAKERRQEERAEGAICADIRKAAAGRRICCALGRQDKSKGFDWFADLYAEHLPLRETLLFAFGGKVDGEVAASLASFEQAGGFACNRFVTDSELLDIYAAADLIWCAYDPGYDQASGILGRAVQLGIPVMVRRGSLAHRLCKIEGFAHLAIDPTTDVRAFANLPPREDEDKAVDRARRMGAESLERLRAALGVAP